ncbi:hypothetical protein XENOCAPTIV_001543 [Xenoophorus captivus]|uniref:Uncharacterized protein n=1 Tax=Xenoophorus captivus TaxID=1517983 RepID=A0ABV0S339_9TELE
MQLLLRRQDPVPSAFQLLRTSSAESRMVCGDVVAVWEVALSDGVYRIEFAHGTTTGKRVVYVNGTSIKIHRIVCRRTSLIYSGELCRCCFQKSWVSVTRPPENLLVETIGNRSCQEVLRKDWMFKLVGKETFTLGRADTKATINIEAISGFTYEYSLNVDGKSLQKFIDNRAKTTKTWVVQVDGTDYRVVLAKVIFVPFYSINVQTSTIGPLMFCLLVSRPQGEFVDDGTETHFLVGEHDCCIKAMSCGKKKNGIVHCLLLDGEKVPAPTQMNYQLHLANSAAIRSEIQRFESVHPNIYSIYELLERVEEPLLQNQIREHVIAIEGRTARNAAGFPGPSGLLLRCWFPPQMVGCICSAH